MQLGSVRVPPLSLRLPILRRNATVTMNRRDNKGISCVCGLLFACLIACTGLAGLFAQAPLERAAKQPVSDLGQKAIRRMISGKSLVVHALGFQPFARPLIITDDSWTGGTGNWNATTWSLGSMPGINNNAVITNSGGLVTLNVSDTIGGNLTIGSANILNFFNNTALTIDGTTITNSNHTGSGGITMSSVGNSTLLVIGSSAVSLTGGGIVTLSNNANNIIEGGVAADVLTNVNNTIQGSGNIGNNQMGLVNQSAGIIDADQSIALTIHTSNGTTNAGTLEATNGANLILNGDTYTNTGGTILASGPGSFVTLLNPTIVGGTLNTAGGGLIQASGNPTLNGVTIASTGIYQLPNNNDTTLVGTITNNGSIQQLSGGNSTDLILGGASVTLTGGGTVTMGNNNTNNRIYGAVGADVLTNVNNTIQGSGQIGAGQMGLVNQSAGIIDANQPNTLTIDTTTGTTNTGTLEATSGATPVFAGSDTYTNTGGTILASGGVVSLTGTVTIVGGTLNTASGGLIEDTGGNPTLSGVTNKGTYQVLNNEFTQLVGTLTNQGTIQLNSNGNTTELQANGAVTLAGGGAIVMSDNNNNFLLQSVSGSSMTNFNNTISGSGNIGNSAMAFTNDAGGIVDAMALLPML